MKKLAATKKLLTAAKKDEGTKLAGKNTANKNFIAAVAQLVKDDAAHKKSKAAALKAHSDAIADMKKNQPDW